MKKLLLFLIVFAQVNLFADQTQEAFLKAGAGYEQGRVKQALELYEKITVPYPSVLYNRGLCEYALGSYARALADFRRAQRTGSQELFAKASRAVALTQQKLGLAHDSSLFHFRMAAHTVVSGDFLRLLFLMVMAGLALLVMLRRSTRVRLLVFTILLVSVGACCGYDYWSKKQVYGVVIVPQAILYAGPDKEFHKVGEVPAGHQVKVVQHDQSWYKVYLYAGQGWVEQADLELF